MNARKDEDDSGQRLKEDSLPGSLLRNHDFLKLWSAQTVSVFGTLISRSALSFTAILFLQATPFQLSLIRVSELIPGCLAGLIAGVWVDRLRRRPLMIFADLARALLLVTIPLAATLHQLRIEQLYIVVFLVGLLTLIFDIADRSYLPTLISKEKLLEANGKMTASASVAEFGAFGIAGWLVQWLTGPIAVLIDALSFLASAALLGTIRKKEPPDIPSEHQEPLLKELRVGLDAVRHQPLLLSLLIGVLLLSLSGGIFGTVVVAFMARDLGFKPGLLGMIWAIGGVTSFIGATLSGKIAKRIGIGRSIVFGMFGIAAGVTLLPLAHGATLFSILLLIGNQLISDPFYAIYEISAVSLRQSLTPDKLQGRVNATFETAAVTAMLIGTLAAGWLGMRLGLRGTLWIGAGITLTAFIWLLASPLARNMNRENNGKSSS